MKFFKKIMPIAIVITCLSNITIVERSNGENVYNEISCYSKQVLKEISEKNDSAISIAVMDEGKIVYSDGFGLADRENNLKVNDKTLFNIASISKIFTAVAIMLLVDEKKIRLDEKLTTYLPEFKMADERYKEITIRMLLDHSSGLGDVYNTDIGYSFNPDENNFLIETLKDLNLSFKPGYANVYCNSGYNILQTIIEKISKKNFIDFLNEKIFIPLELNNTWLSVGERKNNNIAKFYDDYTKKAYPNEVVSDLGACGLSSTPTDLCLFGKIFCLNGKKLLSQASVNKMVKAPSTLFFNSFNDSVSFGLGWDPIKTVKNSNGTVSILTKNGVVPHYRSNFIVVPECGLVIAIVSTNNAIGTKDIEFYILDALLKSKGYDLSLSIDLLSTEQKIPNCFYKYKGNYTDGHAIYNFSFDDKNSTLIVTDLKNVENHYTFKYYNGYFKVEQKQDCNDKIYYFKEVDEVTYFTTLKPKWNGSFPCMQQIQDSQNIFLSEKIENKVWLRRNSKPYHQSQSLSNHIVIPYVYKQVPGYISFIGVNKIKSPNYAGFSSILRDGIEFNLFKIVDQVWINCNGIIYSSDDLCKNLQVGKNSIKIGEQIHSEWFLADTNYKLDFEVPKNARIAIFNSKGMLLYDNIMNTGSFITTEKCYIECIGSKGDEFNIITS